MPPPVNITLYFDVASPWSYICLVTLLRYRTSWNIDLDLKPTFLGGVMDYSGNKPPGTLTYKAPYLERELERVSEQYGFKISAPPGFPLGVTTLNVVRFLRALKAAESPETFEKCTLKLFHEFWVFNTQLTPTPQKFFQTLVSHKLLSESRLSEIFSASQSPENKERIKIEAREFVDTYKAFGMPWVVATHPKSGEVDSFFGVSQLESLGIWLGEEYKWKGPWPDGKPREKSDIGFIGPRPMKSNL